MTTLREEIARCAKELLEARDKHRRSNMELKQILSVTKPVATKDFVCAWSHPPNEHTVSRGRKYVRCVWEPKEGKIQSDHICVECWTSK